MYKKVTLILALAVISFQGVVGDWGFGGDCSSYHKPLPPNKGRKMILKKAEMENENTPRLDEHDVFTYKGATVETYFAPLFESPPSLLHIKIDSDKGNIFAFKFYGGYDQVVFKLSDAPGGDSCNIYFKDRNVESVYIY